MPKINYITDTNQYEITLNPGERCSLCTCGHSKTLPLCDSAHREINETRGTSYRSLKVTNPSEDNRKIMTNSGNWKKEQIT